MRKREAGRERKKEPEVVDEICREVGRSVGKSPYTSLAYGWVSDRNLTSHISLLLP